MWPDWRLRLLGAIAPEPRSDNADARLRQRVGDRYSVKQVNLAYVVEIGAWAHSPELARDLSVTAADEYLESRLDARLTSTRRAIEWFEERLETLRDEVNANEAALEEFRANIFRDGRCIEAWDQNCEQAPAEELEELRSLERDAEATRVLYEAFLERAQQIDDMTPTLESDARVVSLPDIPLTPSRPSRLHYALISGGLGLLAGAVSALLQSASKRRRAAV